MPLEFEHLAIWRRTLARTSDDPNEHHRERLRQAFFQMRDNAAAIVSMIPEDCADLTVHDITHLDALWEMASIIAGDDFEINPAEAFVLGGAILLHDAGMAVAAYPNGLVEIQETVEWRDAIAAANSAIEIPSHENQAFKIALFDTLRALHARHAETLATATWRLGAPLADIALIPDPDLRQAYGRAIGIIAHSHHWNLQTVADRLNTQLGAAVQFPSEWTVNLAKVACLLRCSDAAHIDQRRAPSFLYALRKPQNISALHWTFQNRLNKPHLEGRNLSYSSNTDFRATEADAWWLCHDIIQMIDHELNSSNALLADIGEQRFRALRVRGADSTSRLAQLVRTQGWTPVDTAIRVSNPTELATVLGGEQLYGDNPTIAIRELLQNAIDGIRARRQIEERAADWGTVSLTLELLDVPTLHVDDSGTGMSERVLSGPLIDFGKSLWKSPMARDEFPGLASSHYRSIGRFGIGFFSTFMLGEHVSVISRKFNKGAEDTHVLEFREGLRSRAVLRKAGSKELPPDIATRVSVEISNPTILEELEENSAAYIQSLISEILSMVASTDVTIHIKCDNPSLEAKHSADWINATPKSFLKILSRNYTDIGGTEIEELKRHYERLITPLTDEAGQIWGRAALKSLVFPDDHRSYRDKRDLDLDFVSIGGISCRNLHEQNFVGILNGDPASAVRNKGIPNVPEAVLSNWATQQAKLIAQLPIRTEARILSAHRVLGFGGNPLSLPVCISSEGETSLTHLEAIVKASTELLIPLGVDIDELLGRSVSVYASPMFDHFAARILLEGLSPNVIVFDYDVLDIREHTELNDACRRASRGRNDFRASLDISDFDNSKIGRDLFHLVLWLKVNASSTWGSAANIFVGRRNLNVSGPRLGRQAKDLCFIIKATED